MGMRRVFQLVLFAVVFCNWQPSVAAVEEPGISTPRIGQAAIEEVFTNHMVVVPPVRQAPDPPPVSGATLMVVSALIVGGALVMRRLAPVQPESLDSWRETKPSAGEVAAQEQSFSEFAAAFTVGPATPPQRARPQAPAKDADVNPARDPLDVFFGGVSQDLTTIRKLVSDMALASETASREANVAELLRQIRSFKGKSGLPAVLHVWQMTYALESLVQQLVHKPGNQTPSTMRTVASAVDLLHSLCVPGCRPDLVTQPAVRLLAVDDDAISRLAVAFSLKKVLSPPDLAAEGKAGLALAEAHPYDVIFLDVEMPGMDGFELCSRIHGTALNRITPVIFVTSHSDFNSRAKSTLIGGQDLIGKPFLTFELAVKALTIVMRRRLQSQAFEVERQRGGQLAPDPQTGVPSTGRSDEATPAAAESPVCVAAGTP